jgi:hypothetical protein
MIDTLKYAQRIERELGIENDKATSAAFIARDMLVEASRDLATKSDLQGLTIRFGVMLGVAVGIILAGTAYLLPLASFARGIGS